MDRGSGAGFHTLIKVKYIPCNVTPPTHTVFQTHALMLILIPDNAVNLIQSHACSRIKYFPVINAVTTELLIKYMTFSIQPNKDRMLH